MKSRKRREVKEVRKVILLLAASIVLSVTGTGPIFAQDWPMFGHDSQHTRYSTSTAPATNDVLWSYKTGFNVRSSPAVADGKVFVGSNDNKLYCLSASDGSLIWSYQTGGIVDSSPAVADGKVFVGSKDDKICCFGS